MTLVHRPLRLRLDGAALVANWRRLAQESGPAACGAAVKADAYGLGARDAALRLSNAGCRDFFVSHWAEAEEIANWVGEGAISVLHGVSADDMDAAIGSRARPVLSTPLQVARWRDTGRPFDVMVDSGINRLGISPGDVAAGLLDGLRVETLMSHLACADEDVADNRTQLAAFAALRGRVDAKRMSLANSAGIFLGRDYAFDLTRPGLALYGGIPRHEAEGTIERVVRVEAQVLQRKRIGPGERVGYNGTFTAERACELAVINIGYADGYLRGFSNRGRAFWQGAELPVAGRVSMDLTTLRVDAAPDLAEGDWVEIDYDLPTASAGSGLSQYELLTTLGQRFERIWS
ncbi:MAG: alanine racemase [Allosphingosinicella sp.]|uniref:alanine racemase n=1 Tax=Allosphingosinicella sp. TaxID=2823234 RepID=UPI0039475AA5